MSKSINRAIISHLKIAMQHIIKWLSQPDKRSASWQASIHNAQKAIAELRSEKPSIPDSLIHENWDKKFKEATKNAEDEMNKKSTVDKLTWEQVFEIKYILTILFIIGLIITGFFIHL